MEDCTIHNENKKRVRVESSHDICSPEPKLPRVDSVPGDPELSQDNPVDEGPDLNEDDSVHGDSESDRVDSVTDINESFRVNPVEDSSHRVDPVNDSSDRVDSVGKEPESPDTIQLTDEILDILEDADIDSSIQGLDSVIKSFEEEITTPFAAPESGELDYLLGASDDELGLPPAKSPPNDTPEDKSTESVTSPYENIELKQDFSFVDELPVYDPAEFELGEDNYDRSEFITLGNGLFDYSETPDYLWQPESLTAL